MNNILFIDDSEATRTLIASYLETIDDCKCYTVEKENKDLIEKCDLILIDYDLKYCRGTELADKIKMKYPDKSIYIYTGYDSVNTNYPVISKGNFSKFMDVINKWIFSRNSY